MKHCANVTGITMLPFDIVTTWINSFAPFERMHTIIEEHSFLQMFPGQSFDIVTI